MHFHLPKPLHGWREFVGEVGIIVIGVLIALAFEAVVEDLHWRRQVRQSDEAFKDELGNASLFADERIMIQPCLTGRLAAIAAQLNAPGDQWRAMPENFTGGAAYYRNVLPVVYRPPTRDPVIDSWTNALANGTVNHVPAERRGTLAAAYDNVRALLDYQREEEIAEAKLGPLGTDRSLSGDSRLEILQVVSDLDRINNALRRDSQELIGNVQQLRFHYDRNELEKYRRSLLDQQRGYRGKCVRDVRLDLG
jgi:hypothetical protein